MLGSIAHDRQQDQTDPLFGDPTSSHKTVDRVNEPDGAAETFVNLSGITGGWNAFKLTIQR